jgi:hypothetical protein
VSRAVVAIAALAGLLLTTGCTSSARYEVRGQVQEFGGINAGPRLASNTDVTVRATSASGKAVATVRTDEAGRFRVMLPAGTSRFGVSGDNCNRPTVRARSEVSVLIRCVYAQ